MNQSVNDSFGLRFRRIQSKLFNEAEINEKVKYPSGIKR